MYANFDHAMIIEKMSHSEFDKNNGDYPLIMTGPRWKKFKSSYCEFVQVLVYQCQYSIMYDGYMMDNVISILTGLSIAHIRAFRHTSTLAAMKLMTALVDVTLNLDNSQRQLESERTKRQKRAEDRQKRNMLTYLFDNVFKQRYRDICPKIRSICMAEIGVWMKESPTMFLVDSHLTSVATVLWDEDWKVRLCCLKTLAPLYEIPGLYSMLECFTIKYKNRFVEMTLDEESEVAVQAIILVTCLLKYSKNVLSDKNCETVSRLVYTTNRSVAQAAGKFLNHKLFKRNDEAPPVRSKKKIQRSPNTPLVRNLVQFFITSELHEHAAYLVDSLWEINDMMKDWECMTDLLLGEPGKGEEALDDKQKTSLIQIMVCCVKQAATGDSPIDRGPNKKMSAKNRKRVSEDKWRLTMHFNVALPQLLLKYLMDAKKVANLIQIPLYFDLDIYISEEKDLELLLRYINDIVEKHTDYEVFEACSKCLECLCSEEFSLAGKCEVSKKTLIDASVIKLKQAVQDYSTKEDTPVKDKIFSLLAALKKIAAFYSCHDLSNWELWGDIFTVVKWAEEKASIPEEVIVTAIAASFIALKWFFYRLDNTKLSEDERISLSWKLALFMGSCYKFMCHESEKVKEAAYAINCELLVMFSPDLAKFNRLLKHTVSDEKLSVTALLLEFLQKKVFVEGNDDIQDKHKRRCLLNMFGNLVAYNIVDITLAAPYFKNYMKFNNDYDDIIESTIAKARETNNLKTAKTLGISLQQLFKELQVEHGDVDRLSDAFKSIKDLSGRFALFFIFDKIKNREAVSTVHKDGIIFSLTPFEKFNKGPNSAPPNLAFLEVLYEFTNNLKKQDKMTVVNYLDKLVEGKIPQERQEDWEPFYTYRNSLMQGVKEWNPFFLRQAEQEFYGIKNRQDASSDTRNEPHTPGPMSVQPMTSTPVKGHHHHEKDEDSNMESNIASEHDYDDS